MKTKVTKENLTPAIVKKGLSNIYGFDFENTPTVRVEVSKQINETLIRLQRGN